MSRLRNFIAALIGFTLITTSCAAGSLFYGLSVFFGRLSVRCVGWMRP